MYKLVKVYELPLILRYLLNVMHVIQPKCAQQDNGLDCGYYVMKFMYDIVTCCTNMNDVEKVFIHHQFLCVQCILYYCFRT